MDYTYQPSYYLLFKCIFLSKLRKAGEKKKQTSLITICHQYHEFLTSSFQERLGNKSCMCHTDKFLLSKEDFFTHTVKYFWICWCHFIDYSKLQSIILKEYQEGTELTETTSFTSHLQCVEMQFSLYYQTIHLISFFLSEPLPNYDVKRSPA